MENLQHCWSKNLRKNLNKLSGSRYPVTKFLWTIFFLSFWTNDVEDFPKLTWTISPPSCEFFLSGTVFFYIAWNGLYGCQWYRSHCKTAILVQNAVPFKKNRTMSTVLIKHYLVAVIINFNPIWHSTDGLGTYIYYYLFYY